MGIESANFIPEDVLICFARFPIECFYVEKYFLSSKFLVLIYEQLNTLTRLMQRIFLCSLSIKFNKNRAWFVKCNKGLKYLLEYSSEKFTLHFFKKPKI